MASIGIHINDNYEAYGKLQTSKELGQRKVVPDPRVLRNSQPVGELVMEATASVSDFDTEPVSASVVHQSGSIILETPNGASHYLSA